MSERTEPPNIHSTCGIAFRLLRGYPMLRYAVHFYGAGRTTTSGYRVQNCHNVSAGDNIHVLTFDWSGFGRSRGLPRSDTVGGCKEKGEGHPSATNRALPERTCRDRRFITDLVGRHRKLDQARIRAKGDIGRWFWQCIRMFWQYAGARPDPGFRSILTTDIVQSSC